MMVLVAALSACASQIVPLQEHTKAWVGRPLADYRAMSARSRTYADEIAWGEKWAQLPNGNREYLRPVRPGCIVRWEINPSDTIVGARSEGDRCW